MGPHLILTATVHPTIFVSRPNHPYQSAWQVKQPGPTETNHFFKKNVENSLSVKPGNHG